MLCLYITKIKVISAVEDLEALNRWLGIKEEDFDSAE